METLIAFKGKSGAAGFSWDHDIFTDPDASDKKYAQFKAWQRILATLRKQWPDIIMDHRQQADQYGPFYQLTGSYNEPLGSDENPETFGVPFPTLHTDHVYADQVRIVNSIYATQQLIPAIRMPGFLFHQIERVDENGICPYDLRLFGTSTSLRAVFF